MEHPLINKIESRLQFAITIATVFLVAFPGITQSGYILVVTYILDYIALVILAKHLKAGALNWVNYITLAGIASFIAPLAIVAMTAKSSVMPNWIAWVWVGSSIVSAIVMMAAPVLLLLFILWKGIDWRHIV